MPAERRASFAHGRTALRAVLTGIAAALLILAGVPPAMSAEEASGERNRDAEVCSSLENAIGQLQNARHHRVASVVMEKASESTAPPRYESKWSARVQFYLDYMRPEEDPYLQGMLRCRSEEEKQASKTWLDWASKEIEKRRSLLLNQIAFRQEERVEVLVRASLDAQGGLVPESVGVFFVLPSRVIPAADYVRMQPTSTQLEAAGYDYLKGKGDGTQGGGDTSQLQGDQGSSGPASGPVSGSAPVAPASGAAPAPQTRDDPQVTRTRNDFNATVMTRGVLALVLLAALMALNQYLVYKKPRR